MKQILIVATTLCTIILLIPTLLVQLFSSPTSDKETEVQPEQIQMSDEKQSYTLGNNVAISVFRSQLDQVEEVPLEEYVIGVVASEMPADFEIEALKAQALTARTYIINHMLHPGDIQLPAGAVVTDSVMHQVYHNEKELKKLWGKEYEWKSTKIKDAVFQTKGQVLTFEGKPITASFFSTSNGYTENSEDYWQNEIPYLRSVESPWDQSSPKFTSEKVVSIPDFEQKLGVSLKGDQSIGAIQERTDGGRVAKVQINGKELSGREVRDKLELDSSDFQWQREGNNIIIQTRGWGHGVGMSQYGADGMAKEGKTYKEIVQHYYQGITIQTLEPYIAKLDS